MAGELEVLRTLRELRTGEQQRRESRRTHSLQMMQFQAMQKQQEFQNVGLRLQMLQDVNEQLILSHADDFVTTTGIGGIYHTYSDGGEELDEVVDELQSQLGLTKSQANRATSALVGYYESQNPAGIMSIAGKLSGLVQKSYDPDSKVSKDEQKFVNGLFSNTPLGADRDQGLIALSSIDKVMENRDDILSEIIEYGKTGDIEIGRDIGIFDPEVEKEAFREIPSAPLPTTEESDIFNITEDFKPIDEALSDLKDEYVNKQESIQSLKRNTNYLERKDKFGISLSEEEKQFLVRGPEIESLLVVEMDSLNKDIHEKKAEKRQYERMHFEHLSDKYPGFEGTGPGGLF